MEQLGLAGRAAELGLTPDEFELLQPRLTDGVAAAVFAAVVRHEDALAELGGLDSQRAQRGQR